MCMQGSHGIDPRRGAVVNPSINPHAEPLRQAEDRARQRIARDMYPGPRPNPPRPPRGDRYGD